MKYCTLKARRRHTRLSIISFVLAALFVCPAAAETMAAGEPEYADEMYAQAPAPFNGSFGEWSLRGGAVLPSSSQASPGWAADLGFRNSFPMYLGDNRLAYNYTRYSLSDRTAQIHGLHATLGLHPFYLALLSQGRGSHFLASLHFEAGLGPRFAMLSAIDNEEASTRWGIAGSVGAGFDLPITNANAGQGLWLNAVYRRSWSSIRFDINGASPRMHDHGFFFGLAWRNNGTIR